MLFSLFEMANINVNVGCYDLKLAFERLVLQFLNSF